MKSCWLLIWQRKCVGGRYYGKIFWVRLKEIRYNCGNLSEATFPGRMFGQGFSKSAPKIPKGQDIVVMKTSFIPLAATKESQLTVGSHMDFWFVLVAVLFLKKLR